MTNFLYGFLMAVLLCGGLGVWYFRKKIRTLVKEEKAKAEAEIAKVRKDLGRRIGG